MRTNIDTLGGMGYNDDHWKEIISDIDETTGKFYDDKVLSSDGKLIRFFKDAPSTIQAGFKPIAPSLILKNFIEVSKKGKLNENEVTKVVLFYAQIMHREYAQTLKIIEPYQKMAADRDKHSAEKIFDTAVQLVNFYNKNAILPEVQKTIHRLLDAAALNCIEKNDLSMLMKIRQYQMQEAPQADLTRYIESSKQWLEPKGKHFPSCDGGKVKQGSMNISTYINKSGQKVDRLQFKLNFPERELLQNQLKALSGVGKQEIGKLFPKGMSLKTGQPYSYLSKNDPKISYTIGTVSEFTFEDLGKVMIGDSPEIGSLYNRITVEIPHQTNGSNTVKKALQMLTSMGLGDVFQHSNDDDAERKKLMLIFRTFFPRECFEFENDPKVYSMSVADLRKTIEGKCPKTKGLFKNYLEDRPTLIKIEEVYEGKEVFAIGDVSKLMREKGAVCLMSGITGALNPKACGERLLKIFENGMLSSQDRFDRGLMAEFTSSEADHKANAGDMVFTRLLPKKIFGKNFALSSFSKVQAEVYVFFNLDIVNRGCYMYDEDNFGEKNRKASEIKKFKERLTPLEFSEKIERAFCNTNEVMIKNCIPASFISKILVPSKEHKDAIIAAILQNEITMLENKSLVKKENKYYYNNVELDELIVVTNKLSDELLKRL